MSDGVEATGAHNPIVRRYLQANVGSTAFHASGRCRSTLDSYFGAQDSREGRDGSGENEQDIQVLIAARVIQAHISHNHVRPGDLRDLIRNVHAALTGLSISDAVETAEPAAKATAAQIKRSIMPDGLVSFEDGKSYKFKSYKLLRRHLTQCGLTPQAYREKWGLPADYPMVAPEYVAKRSELAKSLSLGRGGRASSDAADTIEVDAEAPE